MKQPALGLKITELRNLKRITQKELAEQCKVDIRTIQRIEAGEVMPRMYTLNLLSEALGYNFKLAEKAVADTHHIPLKILKLATIAGLVYSLNAIPVVIELTRHSLDDFARVATLTVHSVSCILFFYGFYLIGRQSKNQLMAICAVLTMVLLPLNNIDYLQHAFGLFFAFLLLCFTCVGFGIGLLVQSNKSTHNFKTLYAVAGITGIVVSCMFLSFIFKIQAAGLVISIAGDLLLTFILYREYQKLNQPFAVQNTGLVLN